MSGELSIVEHVAKLINNDYGALDTERQRLEEQLRCGGVTCHANQYQKERDEALAKLVQAEHALTHACQQITDYREAWRTAEQLVNEIHDLLHKADAGLAALEDAHSDYSQLALRNEITAALDKVEHG